MKWFLFFLVRADFISSFNFRSVSARFSSVFMLFNQSRFGVLSCIQPIQIVIYDWSNNLDFWEINLFLRSFYNHSIGFDGFVSESEFVRNIRARCFHEKIWSLICIKCMLCVKTVSLDDCWTLMNWFQSWEISVISYPRFPWRKNEKN